MRTADQSSAMTVSGLVARLTVRFCESVIEMVPAAAADDDAELELDDPVLVVEAVVLPPSPQAPSVTMAATAAMVVAERL